ncbi:MAG: ribokinase [Muribaculaceae bacterium]|nr:ribokinase [Muribaculaceae bacterium]
MNSYDICCIGHITLDRILTPTTEVYMAGGTSFYFAHAMERLDHSGFILVASLANTEIKAVLDLEASGVEVKVVKSDKSVFFENIYGENMNDRTQKVRAKADPFRVIDIEDIESKYYHLGTLLADDFPISIVETLKNKGKVSVDSQGFLRKVVGEDVFACEWEGKEEWLPYIDILKANEHEMIALTGTDDPLVCGQILAEMGVQEVVMTLGDMGSAVYSDGKLIRIPALPVENVVDATGCGDTYMAGYIYMRSKDYGIYESGLFGAALCSMKLCHSGPFSGSLEEVKAFLAEHNHSIPGL